MEFQRAAIAVQGGGTKRSGHVLVQPFVQPDGEGHIAFFGQINTFIGFGELSQLDRQLFLRWRGDVTEDGVTVFLVAHHDAAFPAPILPLAYHAVTGRSSFCHGFSPPIEFCF